MSINFRFCNFLGGCRRAQGETRVLKTFCLFSALETSHLFLYAVTVNGPLNWSIQYTPNLSTVVISNLNVPGAVGVQTSSWTVLFDPCTWAAVSSPEKSGWGFPHPTTCPVAPAAQLPWGTVDPENLRLEKSMYKNVQRLVSCIDIDIGLSGIFLGYQYRF